MSDLIGSIGAARAARFARRILGNAAAVLAQAAGFYAAAIFALLMLMLIGFVPIQQNADGLILGVMSLQKPTLYYWGADRFGNLTVLLASFIRNPLVNEYAQILLQIAAGLLAPLFFSSLAFRRARDAWRAALLTDGLVLTLGSWVVLLDVFVETTPYAISLACAGLASLALGETPALPRRTWRICVSATLLLAAYIVNFGLIILALPLVGLWAALFPSARSARLALLHVFAAAFGFMLPPIIVPEYRTALDLHFSVPNFLHYAAVVGAATTPRFAAAAVLPACALAAYLVWTGRRRALRLLLAMLAAMLVVLLLFFCVVASSYWVTINHFHTRYFTPGYLMLMSIGGVSLWLAARVATRGATTGSGVFAGLSIVFVAMIYWRFHTHPADNSDIVDARQSGLARAVAAKYVAHGLDGIAGAGDSGGYWQVWPAVLMTEQFLYDSDDRGADVFGIAFRGAERRREFLVRLAARKTLRIACIDLDTAGCAASVSAQMQVPDVNGRQIAPNESLPGGHFLGFTEVTLGGVDFGP